jgi:hypothetical protein
MPEATRCFHDKWSLFVSYLICGGEVRHDLSSVTLFGGQSGWFGHIRWRERVNSRHLA